MGCCLSGPTRSGAREVPVSHALTSGVHPGTNRRFRNIAVVRRALPVPPSQGRGFVFPAPCEDDRSAIRHRGCRAPCVADSVPIIFRPNRAFPNAVRPGRKDPAAETMKGCDDPPATCRSAVPTSPDKGKGRSEDRPFRGRQVARSGQFIVTVKVRASVRLLAGLIFRRRWRKPMALSLKIADFPVGRVRFGLQLFPFGLLAHGVPAPASRLVVQGHALQRIHLRSPGCASIIVPSSSAVGSG